MRLPEKLLAQTLFSFGVLSELLMIHVGMSALEPGVEMHVIYVFSITFHLL